MAILNGRLLILYTLCFHIIYFFNVFIIVNILFFFSMCFRYCKQFIYVLNLFILYIYSIYIYIIYILCFVKLCNYIFFLFIAFVSV